MFIYLPDEFYVTRLNLYNHFISDRLSTYMSFLVNVLMAGYKQITAMTSCTHWIGLIHDVNNIRQIETSKSVCWVALMVFVGRVWPGNMFDLNFYTKKVKEEDIVQAGDYYCVLSGIN